MTLSKLISMIRARWLLVVAITMIATLTALAVSLSMAKKYVATSSIVIDAKPDPISSIIYPGMSSPAFMNTQVDVLRSDRVAYRVVRDLKLADNPQLRQQWQEQVSENKGSIEQWLSTSLQPNMSVIPSRESNVLQVSYRAEDPRFAAVLANAFVQAYMSISLELRVDPARRYASYFDAQVKSARQELEVAQNKLSEFQRENGIIGTDERFDVENSRLNELSSQLVALQALSAESGSRQTQAAGSSADRLQEVLTNPLVSQLRSDLNRAESRLQELNTRYGESHPQVIEAKVTASELRDRLNVEMRRVSGGAAVSNTINRQRESEVRASLEAQRTKLLRLKAVRDDATVLIREVDSKQRAFDGISARLTQSNLESQNNLNNANVLTEAVPPTSPSSPRVALNTALALFAGLVLGLGLVLLLELRDRRVRDTDDAMTAMQLPLLGVLPAPSSARNEEKGRLLGMERRLSGHRSLADGSKGAA